MDLSIIIVNWNTRDLLAKCLDSLSESLALQPISVTETFVVDNASIDGSADFIREAYPWVQLMANPTNEGFAAANNSAFRKCSGEFVLLLNPDAELVNDALPIMLAFMKARPEAGAVGPALVDSNGSLQDSSYPMPTLSREFWRLFHLDLLYSRARYPLADWRDGEPREVDVLQGACVLLRRASVSEREDLFPTCYFMYTEDVDLCFRLHRDGWAVHWMPSATAIHHGGQSTRQVRTEMFIELYRSKIEFFRRRRGAVSASLYKVLLFAASLPRVLAAPFLTARAMDPDDPGISNRYLHLMKALAHL